MLCLVMHVDVAGTLASTLILWSCPPGELWECWRKSYLAFVWNLLETIAATHELLSYQPRCCVMALLWSALIFDCLEYFSGMIIAWDFNVRCLT